MLQIDKVDKLRSSEGMVTHYFEISITPFEALSSELTLNMSFSSNVSLSNFVVSSDVFKLKTQAF